MAEAPSDFNYNRKKMYKNKFLFKSTNFNPPNDVH